MSPIDPFLPVTETGFGRRRSGRFSLLIWLLMLGAVLFAAFKFMPSGPVEVLSDRQARKLLAEAERMENLSLIHSAAEIYHRVTDNNRVGDPLRAKAARGLARVSRAIPGHANDVEAALEKAYYYTPAGPDRDGVRMELENLRGRPLTAVTPPPGDRARAELTLPPAPDDAHLLARIGDQEVTHEEVLYAWSQFNGQRDPSPEQLAPFTRMYLDMVLLADEAHRRDLDRQPATAYDLRVQRVVSLNKALTEGMIRDLATPDAATLKAFFDENPALFATPARALVGHIVVDNEDNARQVARALANGDKFDKVAKKYSLDAGRLQDGMTLGWVAATDPGVPGFGPDPALARALTAMKDGQTTGPLATERGVHWLGVLKTTPPSTRSYEEAGEEVLMHYQKQRLAREREALLARLRESRAIEIMDEAEDCEAHGHEMTLMDDADSSVPTTATLTAEGEPAADPIDEAAPADDEPAPESETPPAER